MSTNIKAATGSDSRLARPQERRHAKDDVLCCLAPCALKLFARVAVRKGQLGKISFTSVSHRQEVSTNDVRYRRWFAGNLILDMNIICFLVVAWVCRNVKSKPRWYLCPARMIAEDLIHATGFQSP